MRKILIRNDERPSLELGRSTQYEQGQMKAPSNFLPKTEIFPIPDNCQLKGQLPPPQQDLAELLAEIAAKRLMFPVIDARDGQEKNA